MPTAVAKALTLPQEGDFLTDGRRLVEVLGKTRGGYEVLDAAIPLEVGRDKRDPRTTEILTTTEIVKGWKLVSHEAVE